LCFERRFSEQNSVIRLKSNILAPQKFLGWLRHCFHLFNRVRAENKYGLGDAVESPHITTKNPFKVPGPPGKPEANSVTSKSLVLTWPRPSDDGGSEVTNYIVEKREKHSAKWFRVTSRQIDECRLKVTGLEEGREYEFQVIF